MTRLTREQLFTPDEQAIVQVMNRTVRRCYLMGQDELMGRNYDYRKDLGAPTTTEATVAISDSASMPNVTTKSKRPDRAIAPVHLGELRDALQMLPSEAMGVSTNPLQKPKNTKPALRLEQGKVNWQFTRPSFLRDVPSNSVCVRACQPKRQQTRVAHPEALRRVWRSPCNPSPSTYRGQQFLWPMWC
jgi:hypothetical protein